MSHDAHASQHESQDKIAFGKVIWVGVVSLAIFAGGTVWAVLLLHHETASVEARTGAYHTPGLGSQEIGIVDQVPFTADRRLDARRREWRTELESYGWIDKAKGVVHVPIERAMDAVVAGALPAGAPR